MKKALFIISTFFIFSACTSHSTSGNTTASTTADSTAIYACSMDPEITGKKGDKCSKCGMDLTEPVAHNEAAHEAVKDSVAK